MLPPVPTAPLPTLRSCFTAQLRKGRYADFSGRAGRREYWGCLLFAYLLWLPCLLPALIGGIGMAVAESGSDAYLAFALVCMAGLVLMLLYILVLTTPLLAVQTRRLHDRGWSGWWLALLYGIISPLSMLGIAHSLYYITLNATEAYAAAPTDARERKAYTRELKDDVHLRAECALYLCTLPSTALSTLVFVLTVLPGQKRPNRYGNPVV